MTNLRSERFSVQNPFVSYARDAGWTYLPRDEALRLRHGDTGLLLGEVLVEQLECLNPDVINGARAEAVAAAISRLPPTIEGNLQAWEHLRGLKTVFVEGERRERNVRVIDPDNPAANIFHVTGEYSFSNGTHRIRPDVVFLINGVPVLIIEAKAATRRAGLDEAMEQIRRYDREGPELFALTQLFALTKTPELRYGATWSTSRKLLFNWRDEQSGDFEALAGSFLDPARLLRVLTDFILFTRTDGELGKAVLRPHQMRAVERVKERAADPRKRRALVWHTQGSGKTYTMITVARVLMEDPHFQNPTVLMLVDRNELEEQLFANLQSLGVGRAVVADSKSHLRALLREDHRGLIVTTIHKFDDMPANMLTRENVYVLVDEAHRTTGGNLGNYLVGALPHATYVGFTGTPIDRTAYGRGTFKVFGVDDERGYLDKYSIKESIGDGTTVPLHYALAPNELQVDRDTLEREFLDVAELEGVADVDVLNRVLDRAVTLRNMLKNRDRVDRVAAHVAEHFTTNVEPIGYKAMLVAVDREACTFYKEALDRCLPPEYSRVVISSGHNDLPHLAAHHLSEEDEERVRKAFRKPDGTPKILIVTEKLLTGFDAPVLYALYLDKPMRDHVLLQAIARANRPYEDREGHAKPAGLVLDYVGIFANLEKALAFDSQDVAGVIDGIEVLQKEFARQMAAGRQEYLSIGAGRRADKAVEAVLEHFRDRERRDRFYVWFGELEETYKILSPDPFLRPYLGDYDALADMYRLVRGNFDPGLDVDRSFLRKTAELVGARTRSGELREPGPVWTLSGESLDALTAGEQPEIVRVFNLIKTLHDLVEEKALEQPFLIPIGERAAKIAEAFGERQLHSQAALDEFSGLVGEVEEATERSQQTGLSMEGFAASWFLRGHGVGAAEEIGGRMGDAFVRFPHWRTDPKQEQLVRVALYKALIGGGVKTETKDMVDEILTNLRRAAA
ncbi:MAG: type I restriction endonuclease subunit R [Chloroflexota bacterium]|nr:MAG: deoxyribonuclease HsdR [Chloroflexota bacterium]